MLSKLVTYFLEPLQKKEVVIDNFTEKDIRVIFSNAQAILHCAEQFYEEINHGQAFRAGRVGGRGPTKYGKKRAVKRIKVKDFGKIPGPRVSD
tara:strand:+ start:194 stop:472 length:279 start_codon:yes stop_codon:yes gene_type:complete